MALFKLIGVGGNEILVWSIMYFENLLIEVEFGEVMLMPTAGWLAWLSDYSYYASGFLALYPLSSPMTKNVY